MTILLLDSYDSFTFNLRSLIEEATGQHVITIHNDSLNQESLSRYIPLFDAVVIGPGPGHPSNPLDVGVIPSLFKESIPILGICLGFQSLCLAEGCDVMRSSEIKHGQVYKITHTSSSIFKNIDQQFDAVRYHSLCVPRLSKSLEKLAYTTEPDGTEVIMATRHLEKPWVGVQFHPESICSKNGVTLVKQFIEIAQEFNKTRKLVKDDQLLGELKEQITNSRTSIEICDILHQQNKEFVLLNSAASPGQWSIIGIISDSTLKITHSTEDPHQISLIQNGITESKPITNIWTFISDYMSQYLVQNESGLPFIGGFMGIFSYEEATEILNTPKELGENLMIVDLIRHDLYELLNKVEVTKLMSVEEYKTVYQLVSVIEGYFEGTPYRGIDILSRALPPGSMTGAPKKRSVEILQKMLEGTKKEDYTVVYVDIGLLRTMLIGVLSFVLCSIIKR
ncbi:Aminodeoxychorismate synthase [Cyberlindnera fabianii]|uniref:aminodeoxychorismate synthase n=1 Tax=Cyberlindnera fabianii TaxID=36022 RepID=A0A1V2LBP3_CYBFA|nr:Aminodeoxychorismate synthase [Cyberlindnera fabianii]